MKAALFDAYGTLLDVHSAMQQHAARLGPGWARISADWRAKHLEYAWVRSLARQHRDFWALARESLHYAAAQHGIEDRALLEDVLRAYRSLRAYPEVPGVLRRLRARGVVCAILSNGTPEMLAEAAEAAGISQLLDAVLSVEQAGVFKPDPRVYALATARFSCPPQEVAFVSANPWDGFGGHHFGFRVFRVNRGGLPDEYDLGGVAIELPDLSSFPDQLT